MKIEARRKTVYIREEKNRSQSSVVRLPVDIKTRFYYTFNNARKMIYASKGLVKIRLCNLKIYESVFTQGCVSRAFNDEGAHS